MALKAPASGPRPVATDDATLVARARAGDEAAFAGLYRRHARYLAGVAYRLMGDPLELDDVVQDAFVAASLSLGSLREPQSVRLWLVTIAVRQVRRRLAARARRRWLGLELAEHEPRVADPKQRAEVDDLYDILARLPDKIRIPWLLAKLEGETLPDVAKICDISLATAKRRIARAQESVERRLHAR